MFFESQIGQYNFRYDGNICDNIIEVSKIGDRNRTILREIPVKLLESEKDFHKEISFWWMTESSSLQDW